VPEQLGHVQNVDARIQAHCREGVTQAVQRERREAGRLGDLAEGRGDAIECNPYTVE
jgi:hypothetical protein